MISYEFPDPNEVRLQVTAVYKAAFDRNPDQGGLAFWVGVVENSGQPRVQALAGVAAGFTASQEFVATYGANPSPAEYIERLYDNVLKREPDPGGREFWIGQLEAGASRGAVLNGIAQSPENYGNNALQFAEYLKVGLNIFGTEAPETIVGTPYSDLINGEGGGDVLTGGSGRDIFFIESPSHGVAAITDFDMSADEEDFLDFREATRTFVGGSDSVEGFLRATPAAGNTLVAVDPSGNGTGFVDVVLLEGRELTTALLSNYGVALPGLEVPDPEFFVTRASNPALFTDGDTDSFDVDLSGDGRFAAFASLANVDNNEDDDFGSSIFLQDILSDVVLRVDTDANGNLPSSASINPSVSDDGRLVAFESFASDLVPGDTNNVRDVFFKNLLTGNITAVSSGGNEASFLPSLSADGRTIAFLSEASNLAAGDANGVTDVFVYGVGDGIATRIAAPDGAAVTDLDLSGNGQFVAFAAGGVVYRANVATGAAMAAGPGAEPSVSADGRYVAFASDAAGLTVDDPDAVEDVFRRDFDTGALTLVSATAEGAKGNAASSSPSLSADGRYVAFGSAADNLVPDDTNRINDVFVKDVQTGNITRASLDASGGQAIKGLFDASFDPSPSLSSDGRFVAFESYSPNLRGITDTLSLGLTVIYAGVDFGARAVDDVGDQPDTARFLDLSGLSVEEPFFWTIGIIDGVQDRDLFAVQLGEGLPYRFDLGGGSSTLEAPLLQLQDQSGSVLASAAGSADASASFEFIPPTDGLFFLSATGVAGDVGSYRLILRLNALSFPGGFTSDSASGELSVPNEADRYIIGLSDDETYRFAVEQPFTGMGLTNPVLRLLDLQGNVLAASNAFDGDFSAGTAIENFTPDADGNHLLEVSDAFGDTGGYRVEAFIIA